MKILLRILLSICALPCVLLAEPGVDGNASAVNAFAVAHHRWLPAGNALTSPLSIEMCMGMVYAGAEGQTREAMRKAFFFPADEAALHTGFQNLRQALLMKPLPGITLDIRVANRIFHEQTLALLPAFTDLTRTNYLAEAAPVDFLRNARDAEKSINQWVSKETATKIPEIIPSGQLNDQTRLVLVNAVYFDLPWEERFTKELTRDQPFFIDASHAKTVPLMFKQHRLGYARKAGFQIAALPYAGGTFQFVVILPDDVAGLAQVERALTGELLSECAKLTPTEVRLSFPRIRMEPPIVSLKRSLTAMGAGPMFGEGQADFSRMTKKPVYVSDVFHRTFIELDEDGTKAASASAAVLIPKNGHPREVPHQIVKADHPFLFMIQHVPSGACLFLGRLTDPAIGAKPVAAKPPEKAPESKK